MGQDLSQEDLLEKEVATHSSILAWEIWTEEPGRLATMGSQRIGHNLATKQQQLLFCRISNASSDYTSSVAHDITS